MAIREQNLTTLSNKLLHGATCVSFLMSADIAIPPHQNIYKMKNLLYVKSS